MTPVSATPGKVICELKVEEEHTNRFGAAHGGLIATLVDVISTIALLQTERGSPGVSVDMNITYVAKLHQITFLNVITLCSNETKHIYNIKNEVPLAGHP